MASSDKRSSSTGSFALAVSATAIPAPSTGMGFNFLPALPIITLPIKFLKSVDLITMGKGLNDVPSSFGWKLVEWKPLDNQFGGLRPDKGFTEVYEVVEVDDDVAEKGPVFEVGQGFDEFGTGSGPVLNFGKTRTESTLIF